MIVAILRPFELKQHFYAYKNGMLVKEIDVETPKTANGLFDLAVETESDTIQFNGSKPYCKGIENKIKELEITKYAENKIKFVYL